MKARKGHYKEEPSGSSKATASQRGAYSHHLVLLTMIIRV